MRLRQVALAAGRLETVTGAFDRVLGLKVAYNDPHIGHYGLKNAVLPVGGAFLEVVQPIRDDVTAARFIQRRGDAGYMVILQAADAPAESKRVAQRGVRIVDEIDRSDYYCAHFHPADFGGFLVSFDQQRTEADLMAPDGDWMPAGPDWRKAKTEEVADLTAVVLAAPDPAALALRWSALIGRSLDPNDPLRLPLDRGDVRFIAAEGAGSALAGVDLTMKAPGEALTRAHAAGLDVNGDEVLIGGVRFRLLGV